MSMDGLGLLLGHLVGDYVFQNDWQAKNKTNPHPGKEPHPRRIWIGCGPAPRREYPGPYSVDVDPSDRDGFSAAIEERNRKIAEWDEAEESRVRAWMERYNSPELVAQREWWTRRDEWRRGHFACTLHCLLYTLAVWLFSFWWMPWWGLLACFAVHWPVDRFRLARKWMEHVSGQKDFANGMFAPWSVIVVDNVFHLLTLFVVAATAGRVLP